MAVGELETPELSEGSKDMIAMMNAFYHRLLERQYRGLRIKRRVVPEAIHETTFPAGLAMGTRWLFGGGTDARRD